MDKDRKLTNLEYVDDAVFITKTHKNYIICLTESIIYLERPEQKTDVVWKEYSKRDEVVFDKERINEV